MPRQRILTPRSARNAARLLMLLIITAGLINIPWALSRYRSRENWNKTPTISRTFTAADYTWPSDTPHVSPWPQPDMQEILGNFGCRLTTARANYTTDPYRGDLYTMQVQHLGWPLPVIEEKQMWWGSSTFNPSGLGIEPDPPPFVLWSGFILNPLIVGGGLWLIIITIALGPNILKRWHRHRHHRCLACGYPVGENAVCTECGDAINPR